MATPDSADLVRRAADLVPLLRSNSRQAARERKVPEANLAALRESGLLDLMRPARYGGCETDMRTKVAVLAEIARGCGSTGWVTTLYYDAAYLLGRFPDHVQDTVFTEPDVLVTATLSPMGTAEPDGDGYLVTGRWPFNTGCPAATWVVQPTFRGGEVVHVLLPYKELVVEDDWDVTGMSGTASNTVRADGVHVPAERVVALADVIGDTHLSARNAESAMYRVPLLPEILTSGAAAFTGMTRAAYELVIAQLAKGTPIAYTAYPARRDAPITHHQVAEAALRMESADHLVESATALVDRRAAEREPYRPEDKPRVWGLVSFATKLYAEAADLIRTVAGASSIRADSPLNLVLQDIQALATHALMMPPTGIEHYGRSLCGLPPSTPLLV